VTFLLPLCEWALCHGGITKLLLTGGAAEKERAATHVAAPGELDGETKPFAEDWE
jgi:hypothetical protein